jgi:ABC-type branched-subunit amino acid transport system substrate-binding protein
VDEALLALGRIYAGRKDYSRASEAFQRIILEYPDSRFKYEALYELGSVMYKTGRLNEARSVLEPVSASVETTAALRAKAILLLDEIKTAAYGIKPDTDTAAIGVLLPLKGNYARFGEDALSGILLAANVFGDGKGSPVEVIVRDVSEPAFVESVVDELSGDPRVVGLVGPLVSSTAVEAARYAQRKGVPLLTLSQKDGITGMGDYVFRSFLTPAAQAATIAQYATTVGKKKFAVLYPQNNYGIELARNFESEVRKRGGEVVRAASYAPGATNFGEEIKRLFGVEIEERREGRRLIKQFKNTVEADALFIPDYVETVGLIAPYLDYYNIKDVQLLGANGWNSPRLITLGGKNVEGAVFVDGFFPAGERPGTSDFVRKFNDAYGRTPGVLEAEAYDAAGMLIAALRNNGGDQQDREGLRDSLLRLRGFHGAEGSITFDSRREAVKKLFLLTVRHGRIIEVPEDEIVAPEEILESGNAEGGVKGEPGIH